MKNHYEELYIVKYEYQKEDGFYETSEADILVDIVDGMHEKVNHEEARLKFQSENKHLRNLTIKKVIYV
jgi:hypothetical protein